MAIAITAASGSVLTRSTAISMAAPLTISAWTFLTTAPSGANAQYIVYLSDTGSNPTSNILLDYDGAFTASVISGASSLVATGSSQATGQWYHVALVLEGNASTYTAISLYQNGTLIQRTTGSISIPSSVSPATYIGNQLSGGTFGTQNNPIAEIAIWNSILTANQIQSLAAGIPPNNFALGHLLSWVSLNQNSGTITDNISSSWVISSSTGVTTSTDPPVAPTLPTDITDAVYSVIASSTSTVTAVFSNPQVAGNSNVVFLLFLPPGVITVTGSDTANGAYTTVGPIVTTLGNIAAYILYKTNIASAAAGTNTFTATFSAAVGYTEMFAAQVNGLIASPFDLTATAKTTTQTGTGSIAITTTNAADKILTAFWQNGGGWNKAGSGFQELASFGSTQANFMDFRKVISTGTYTDTPTSFGSPSEWIALAIALKAAVAAGPAYVQGHVNNASGAFVQTTYTNAQTSGNTNIVAVLTANSTQPTVADTSLNTYILAASGNFAAQNLYLWLFIATSIVSAAANGNTVTASSTVSNIYNGITVLEYSNVSSIQDVAATTATGIGTVWSAPSITTTNANDLILSVGIGVQGGAVTAGTGYTMRQTAAGTNLSPSVEDQIVTTTGTFNGSMTGAAGQQWCVVLAAFKATAPGASVTPVVGGSIVVTGGATPNPIGNTFVSGSGSVLAIGTIKIGQAVSATGGQVLITGSVTPSLPVISIQSSGSFGMASTAVIPSTTTLALTISGNANVTGGTTPITSTPLPVVISGLFGVKAATVTPTIPTLAVSAVGNWTVRGAATPTVPVLSIQIFGNWTVNQAVVPTYFPPFVISGSIGVSSLLTPPFTTLMIPYTASGSFGVTGGATPFLLIFTAGGHWGITGAANLLVPAVINVAEPSVLLTYYEALFLG